MTTSKQTREDRLAFAAAVGRRSAPLLGVALLWLVGASTAVTWLRLDSSPPAWDQSVHLSHSLHYYAYLTRLPFADAWAGLGATSYYYPPLVHTCGALAMIWFGVLEPSIAGFETGDVAVLTNLAAMGLLLYSVYYLARRWYGPPAGLLATFLVTVYPIVAGQSREFLLDYPLTALTALAMALLIASRGLTHPVVVWPLGLVAGAALWCKWSFAFLFAGPLILALREGWARLQSGEDESLTPVRLVFNLVVVLAGAGLLAGPWYLSHLPETVQELLTSNQTWQIDDDPGVLTLAGLTYYPRMLLSEQILLPFTALAVWGGVFIWLHRATLPGGPFLGTWIAAGLVVLWLVPNKDPRFSLPLLPAVAVMSASWLAPPTDRRATPTWQRLRVGLVAAAVLLGALQFQAVAFGIDKLPERIGPRWAPLWSQSAFLTRHHSGLRFPLEAMARDIGTVVPSGGKVGVLPNTAHINFLTLRYYVNRQFLPHLLDRSKVPTVLVALPTRGGVTSAATVETLRQDEFAALITLDGDQGAHAALLVESQANLDRDQEAFFADWRLARAYRLPGGERVNLWRRHGTSGG